MIKKRTLVILGTFVFFLAAVFSFMVHDREEESDKAFAETVDGMTKLDDYLLTEENPINVKNEAVPVDITLSSGLKWVHGKHPDGTGRLTDGFDYWFVVPDSMRNFNGETVTMRYHNVATYYKNGRQRELDIKVVATLKHENITVGEYNNGGGGSVSDTLFTLGQFNAGNNCWAPAGMAHCGAANADLPSYNSGTMNLFDGWSIWGAGGFYISFEFFDSDTGQRYNPNNLYLGWWSLNVSEAFRYERSGNEVVSYYKRGAAYPKLLTGTSGLWVCGVSNDFRDDRNFIDVESNSTGSDIGDASNLWRSAATIGIRGNTTGKYTFQCNCAGLWFAPTFGTTGAYAPHPREALAKEAVDNKGSDVSYDTDGQGYAWSSLHEPWKDSCTGTSDEHTFNKGETVVFDVMQAVSKYGYYGNATFPYTRFLFSSTIPDGLTVKRVDLVRQYVGWSETLLASSNSDPNGWIENRSTMITKQANNTTKIAFSMTPNVLYNKNAFISSHILYPPYGSRVNLYNSENKNYKGGMAYDGEYYTVRIVCTADEAGTYSNQSTMRINGISMTTNTVTITVKNTKYTVNFNANGSSNPSHETGEQTQNTTSGTMAAQEMECDVAAALKENKFTREGYVFNGWNTKADGTGTSYSDKQSVTNLAEAGGSITLYAQWTKKLGRETLNVTDEKTGERVPGVTLKLQKEVNGVWTDVYSKTTIAPSAQININDLHWFQYRWVMTDVPTGYKKATSNTSFSIRYNNLTATNNITLYRTKYKVKYDPNGATNFDHQTGEYTQNTTTGTMADSEYTYDVKGTLRANAYGREGYTFTGWNTKADGTGASYPDGYDNVLNWASGDGDSITLYAQWRKKLGNEVIKIVSEETGNPVKGVTFTLQKKVNGTWTDVPLNTNGTSSATTGSDGTITVSNLHWFDYRWRMTGVPAGYKKSSNMLFTINYNALSASNEIVLYMKTVDIIINSEVTDIINGEQPPAFLYHIKGTDAAGVAHSYNVLVQTSASTKKGRNLAFDIFAGTYEITQTPVSRYVPGTAENVRNMAINGTKATADVLNHNSAEVVFPYSIKEYGWLYGVDSKENRLRH